MSLGFERLITNKMHFFMYLFIYLFISSLYMFRALGAHRQEIELYTINTSSGMISLCDFLVCLPAYQAVTYTRLIIPDDVLIQFDLLTMST